MTAPAPDDEFTELVDATIPRVDLVGKAANGTRFLIAKGDGGGLFAPECVRDLISKADASAITTETVTMTGSPAAIAAMIHGASVRKAGGDDLDPTVALAETDGDAPGDETDPGSPAWEAVDAATACKWTSIVARAKNALCVLAEREMLEAAAGDDCDAENAFDLEDANCALDYVISVLAPYAASEQADSEVGAEQLAMVGKALSGFDPSGLELIEGLAPVVKAGRVLSAGNEAAIRGAVDSLQKVLASLPAPEEAGAPVAKKEATVPATTAPITVPVVAELTVSKAKSDPQVAIYDANGNLVGTVDPGDIAPIANAKAPADADDDEAAGSDASTEQPAEQPAATTEAAVIPGTNTVQVPPEDDDTDVTKAAKSAMADVLAEALAPLAKQLEQHAELAGIVKGLQERVEHLAASPDDRKSPRLNGATGTAGMAIREGQIDGLAELRKAVTEAPTAAARTEAERQLGFAAVKARFQ